MVAINKEVNMQRYALLKNNVVVNIIEREGFTESLELCGLPYKQLEPEDSMVTIGDLFNPVTESYEKLEVANVIDNPDQ